MSRDQNPHRLILEIRAGKSALICQHCERPLLEIVNGEITIESKHGSAKHVNILSAEYVNILVSEMLRQRE